MSTTTTNFLIKGQLISIRVTSLQEELNPLPQRRIKLTSEVNSFNFFCGSKNLFLYFVWPWRDTAFKMTIYIEKRILDWENIHYLYSRRWYIHNGLKMNKKYLLSLYSELVLLPENALIWMVLVTNYSSAGSFFSSSKLHPQ